MMVPDDELCIQQMLGLNEVPEDIESEYALRIRMFHKQGSGGPMGPLALIGMLRFLGYSIDSALLREPDERVDWRSVKIGTTVEVRVGGEWRNTPATFEGEVGGGLIAVDQFGRIDEFNAFDVRLPESELPDEVDKESFEQPPGDHAPAEPDARDSLILSEEQERSIVDELFAKKDEEDKVVWSRVRKGTRIWYRDKENEVHQGTFGRVVKGKHCEIQLDEENAPRKNTSTDDVVLAES